VSGLACILPPGRQPAGTHTQTEQQGEQSENAGLKEDAVNKAVSGVRDETRAYAKTKVSRSGHACQTRGPHKSADEHHQEEDEADRADVCKQLQV
jgi:hypothetical protein